MAVLPTPGLADQHRVVLGAALQHLDRAADLVVAADHRVELALAGALGEVEAVFLERFALAFGIGAVDLLAAAHRIDRGFERLARQAVVAREAADVGLAVGQGEQEQLAGDELVAALDGFLLGGLQQRHQVAAHLDLLPPPWTCGSFLMAAPRPCAAQPCWRRRAPAAPRGPSSWRSMADQQVGGLDVGVVASDGEALAVGEGFLEFGGEFVESHGYPPECQAGEGPGAISRRLALTR